MNELQRLRRIRDDLAAMAEDPRRLGALCDDRGIDLNTGRAEFVMELPDGESYEVQIRRMP